ncbi:MAG: DNA-directed RNA polymerase subunit beta' [bacterium]|nr:DNA-directed RNA polymerase subunit beta' [bacterium]
MMLVNSSDNFDMLSIGLASADRIRYWSYGEVEKPETINYRTFKPERKGLFCEKIFGPVKDWECSCGKYRRVRYRGIVCERCGVEVTHSKVRRERMGHLELAAPVSHIWFLKGIPSYLGLVLDMTARQLEEVVYYDSYIVVEVSPALEGVLEVKQLLSTVDYTRYKEKYGNQFKAEMGAGAVRKLLEDLDLKGVVNELRELVDQSKGQKRLKITKRLRVVESLCKSGNRPEWMILDVIPIMPPDLRPMVQLEGGRFATSDLNDLYRRVVNRNNRLKRLLDIGAPEMIIRNEKRMLQEAVDVLIANGKRGRAVTGSNGRPLKSLGNIIEGKQGRFRQNLLGKRVDYSARSVIVVGPHLKFYQCGLPKEMALELFKPFIIRKLVEEGYVSNVKSAKKKIEKRELEVWDVLEEVIKGQPVLLNRAPTLHRLGIQAFEPVLVEGSAIQIHPLVCTAFNADFDGDQMAVHVPLSLEAQSECRMLIMSSNNILSPSDGRSIVTPTQDMVLGIYYLTAVNKEDQKGKGKIFFDVNEARRAWEASVIGLQTEIKVVIDGKRYETTMGRIIFNRVIWDILHKYDIEKSTMINEIIGKNQLSNLVFDWYVKYGTDVTVRLLDRLKEVGFKYSTLSGISISIEDLRIPGKKANLLEEAKKEIEKIENLHKVDSISAREKELRSNDIWRGVTHEISTELEKELGNLNNVYIMANSGARGNIDQVRQLAGMRGLMSDAQGRTVNIPIMSNFKEGLSITDYFISSYGARKGLVDTALRTADSGYLTRRLVDVAQDVMIIKDECGTTEGVRIHSIKDGVNTVVNLSELIEGCFCMEDVINPLTKTKIASNGDLLSSSTAYEIQEAGIDSVLMRSIFKCIAGKGLCQKCYGLDLASYEVINIGEAVGIIAAQSIGEPGTQLTMRTFHTGGVDLRKAAKVEIKALFSGTVKFKEEIPVAKVKGVDGSNLWVITKESKVDVVTAAGKKRSYLVPEGSTLFAKKGDSVSAGEILAEYDPSYEYVISESEGIVEFIGVELSEMKDEKGNITDIVSDKEGEIFIQKQKADIVYQIPQKYAEKYQVGGRVQNNFELAPGVKVDTGGGIIKSIDLNEKEKNCDIVICGGEAYPILSGASVFVSGGSRVRKGEILARERLGGSDALKTKDIVQGLPRVEELFEARRPKEIAVLSELSGMVEIRDGDGVRIISITTEEGESKDYKIPYGTRLQVYTGKKIEKGDQLVDGVVSPHDILATKGVYETQRYLAEEVQKVYRSQGVKINSKHIQVIVRQMTRKVSVADMGESAFLPNELIDVVFFDKVNEGLRNEGKTPARGDSVLLGVTRASLNTESFVSASSFQQTASVLTKAAIEGQVDPMYGLKENVIIGKLIPAGTGMVNYRNVGLDMIKNETTDETEAVTEAVAKDEVV